MTTANTLPVPASARPLQYLPVSLFGASLGLAGLGVAWHLAHVRFDLPDAVAQFIAMAAGAAFVALAIAYGVKAAFAPDAVHAEFRHPVAGHMFGLLIANLLLLPIPLAPLSLGVARALWGVGAIGMIGLLLAVGDRWLKGLGRYRETATPVWLVPAVGLLDVPLAAPALQLPASWHGVLLLCWSVGLVLSLLLLAVVGARLVIGAALPAPLQPTLLILAAPGAVGASGQATLSGGYSDMLGLILFGFTVPLLLLLLARLRHAIQGPFKTIWWATSFPLAASAIASLRVAATVQSPLTDALAVALLGLASLVVAVLLWHTLRRLLRGELREIV